MKNYKSQAEFLKVLMHPTRLSILNELRGGEQCVCHMEAKFGLRQAYISQHLMILRDAGLVADRRDGWNIYYQVCEPGIFDVIDAVEKFTLPTSHNKKNDLHSDIIKPEKTRACPCPKCNPQSDRIPHESQSTFLSEDEASG